MKIFRFEADAGPRLGLAVRNAQFDLSAADAHAFGTVASWLALPDPAAAVRDVWPRVQAFALPTQSTLLAPLDVQEVWASGVTYLRSKVARIEESEGGGDFYDKVYDAERPELFLKATPRRVVGPNQPIRIRRDSTWDVPEPELTLVLSSSGAIVGYTIGNDVSSRSIEGENPLYLPQAKYFDGCCSLGPVIELADGEFAPRTIRLSIARDGQTAYEGQTSTSQMRRTLEELAGYLFRELTFPDGVFLMTGTGIVPPDDWTLQSGDLVTIEIEGIGTLVNSVA